MDTIVVVTTLVVFIAVSVYSSMSEEEGANQASMLVNSVIRKSDSKVRPNIYGECRCEYTSSECDCFISVRPRKPRRGKKRFAMKQ